VEEALAEGACIGAANWAEVLSKVAESGGEPEALIEALEARGLLGQALEVLPLLPEDGLAIARLRPSTKILGRGSNQGNTFIRNSWLIGSQTPI
jgi:hypothetical protein